MFRFLARWSLEITGSGIVGYHTLLTPQKQADLQGFWRSMTNSTRVTSVVFRSIYDYYYQLKPFALNSEQYHAKRGQIHQRVAKRILAISQQNKGIYLKLGQYIGNLERVVPRQFTDVLRVLQDSTTPLSYDQIKIVIEEELKQKPKQIFDLFQKQAIAAASLAQVHRAVLLETGQQVAVKLQYPFLRSQSKYDLIILKKIVQFCNYLLKYNKYQDIDLMKLFHTWTDTLEEELSFKKEVENGTETRKLFKDQPDLYIPRYFMKYCTERLVVMEYMEGVRIDNREGMVKQGINPLNVARSLTQIFSQMIFKHGFVHCDAHPGNILVRKIKSTNSDLNYQIVLLDHGLYRRVDQEFIESFSGLWLSLVQSNPKKTNYFAKKLNVQKHIEYLPIIFLHRTINSRKKLGMAVTKEQIEYLRSKNLANFESVNRILQDLPPDLMFIIRASNLIATHCVNLGGTTRERILEYTRQSVEVTSNSPIEFSFRMFSLGIKLWLFENFYRMYRAIFGTLA